MITTTALETRPNGVTIETRRVTYNAKPEDNHYAYEVHCPICTARFVAAGMFSALGEDELGHLGNFDHLAEAEREADEHGHDWLGPLHLDDPYDRPELPR